MNRRHLTLVAALLLSMLLHLAVVAGGEIVLPDFYTPPDDVLSRQAPSQVQRVNLVAKTPSAAPHPQHSARRSPRKPATQKAGPVAEKTAAENPVEAPEKNPVPENPAAAQDQKAAAPPPEPAPAFPVQISAVLTARYNGLPFTIHQNWVMEGLRYAINLDASRFGFHFRISSEGSVNPQGGLSPEHYRLLLNDKVRTFADYGNGELRYGRPDNPKNGILPVPAQDMASLPFHVAVTFNGQPQTLIVTTGNSVYEIRLSAEAEETLKLPAGTLRTLHLRGERYDMASGRMQTGYEVWLALDYLNYPVKFSGITGNGDTLEYRLRELDMEGKRVLDAGSSDDTVPVDDAIPEWIRQRAGSEDLNNR